MDIVKFESKHGDKFELVSFEFDNVYRNDFMQEFIEWSGGTLENQNSINFNVPVVYGRNPDGKTWVIHINTYAIKAVADGSIFRVDNYEQLMREGD